MEAIIMCLALNIYFEARNQPVEGQVAVPPVQYLHRQCVPLDQVDLSTAADKGQTEFGFLEECEGMCGI